VRLDLAHHYDAVFFLWFLALATVAKTASVYAGARLGGEPRAGAWNLGVAMNARGGPGIVLATVTYAAGVIDQEFYAALVLLAIVTSLAAGSWLGRLVRVGRFADAGAPARGSAIPAPEQRAPNPATS
jgi:Kef-type K+ transport system membrane component KefB